MLSNITISGRLGEKIDKRTRYVEVDRLLPDGGGKFRVDAIPVRSMLALEGPFMSEPNGAFIVLLGHLEVDEEGHLIVVNELDEIFQMPKGMRKI
ncbi:MAG: hypothetical protein Q4F15_01720 [Bacillota bacterium]|nr:hypothetical protein [Bacillota bacterium]